MTALAVEHNAVNLGQGFPDFDGPDVVKEAAISAIRRGENQYCRSFGHPQLNQALARHQRDFYDLDFDPDTEVTVMSGATEALMVTLQALCETGDEVVVFEPTYDAYQAGIAMAGAVAKPVQLHAPDFSYDPKQLEEAITARTRAIVINTPHNPTGKVFTRDELQHIAELCTRYDLIAITDEVYEHLVFDAEHIPLASLDGMRDRTVTISSSGKTFSFTGWKVGYAFASAPLTRALRTLHQFVTFCSSTPLQLGIAEAYRSERSYYENFVKQYRARRKRLCDGLRQAGAQVLEPQGTYFALTDIGTSGFDNDREYCEAMAVQTKVVAVPVSAFYLNPSTNRRLIRWAFCKSDSSIDEGVSRLRTNPPTRVSSGELS